ncbi:MAG: peptidase domain-containing ABC transporter, partial [Methylococcaceae bacterium]|nr:peptidase domain-containing ABC transporter [Methylococcaceae bacterium]
MTKNTALPEESEDAFEEQLSHNLQSGDVLWLMGSLCGLNRVPFNADLIAQEFPPPYTEVTLHEVAREMGFQTEQADLSTKVPAKLTVPMIAFLKPSDEYDEAQASLNQVTNDENETPNLAIPVLVTTNQNQQLTYFRCGSQTPTSLPYKNISKILEQHIILVGREDVASNGAEDIAGFEQEKKEFGFDWFIPELMKHKSIWRDVLLASLAMQIVGLATPLFTQVIIDKVIVHQTHSTLVVLAVALFMFAIFTSAMTWLRQYLVLHTGNRVDAVLGSQVFRHLMRLPLPYFENRPTGTLVARLQGVETIREFVSGAAVSLILDFPFLLIFLAVMFYYSWQLSIIAVVLLGLIALVSFLVTPVLRDRMNKHFMLGAQNQAFITEYIGGMAT